MPAIYMFRRRTLLGGDDLQPAALMSLILRFVQLTLFLGPVVLYIIAQSTKLGGFVNFVWYGPNGSSSNGNNNNASGDDDCRQSHMFGLLLSMYALLSFMACLACIFLDRRLAYWSSQGCPVHQTEPRSSKVAQLLEFKLVPMTIIGFLVWITGIVSTAYASTYNFCVKDMEQQGDDDNGRSSFWWWWIAFGFLSFSQILEVIVSSIYLLLLLSMPPEPLRPPLIQDLLVDPSLQDPSSSEINVNNNMCNNNGLVVGGLSTRTDATATATASSTRSGSSSSIFGRSHNRHHHHRGRTNSDSTRSSSWAYNESYFYNNNNHELVEEMWADRCTQCCQCLSKMSCFMFGGHELFSTGNGRGGGGTGGGGGAQFGDVARALADYLETRGVLDVVPSDIATGFLVLQRLQRQRMQQARRQVVHASSRSCLRPPSGSGDNKNDESASNSSAVIIMTKTAHLQQQQNNNNGDSSSSDDSFTSCHQVDPLESSSPESQQQPQPLSQQSQSQSAMRSTMMSLASPALSRHSSTFSTSLYRLDSMGNLQRLSRSILKQSSPLDRQVLEEGARYARYALAIYTWVLYLYVHPVTGVARLCWGRTKEKLRRGIALCHPTNGTLTAMTEEAAVSTTAPSSSSPSSARNNNSNNHFCHYYLNNNRRIEGDNIWQTHKTALLLTAGLSEADLVYAQLRSGFRENPYCILLDHDWRSVVVSIRGTFSLEDCVTDVLIEPESLEPLGREFGFDATNQYCHGGVLSCVRNVYRDLQRHGLLQRLLLGGGGENNDIAPLYPGYTLRLVGHSLGAATCTILSYMLRPTFPSVRCVNYSPPGCSLTWDMAVQCQDWCSSFVLDADLVPRLSLHSMERLRDEILELIARIKVPKIQVAQVLMAKNDGSNSYSNGGGTSRGGYSYGGVVNGGGGSHGGGDSSSERSGTSSERLIEEILYHPDQVPDSEYVQQLARFKSIQTERRASRGSVRSIQLYPPGKMVHLVKTAESKSCCHGVAKCLTCFTSNAGFEYMPVWINNDDLNEIVIEPTMGTDHFPNRIQFMLEQVAQDFGLKVR